MQTIFKTLLLLSGIAAIAAVPVSAGNFHNDLRGSFSPQSSLSEFEGRYVQPQGQYIQPQLQKASWQQKRLRRGYNQGYNSPPQYNQSRQGFKRHGLDYGNVYDYESGHCGNNCSSSRTRPLTTYYEPVVRQTYRQVTQYKCWDGSLVATENGCAPQYITTSIQQYKCWDGEIVTDIDGCKQQAVTREVVKEAESSYNNFVETPASYGNSSAQCPAGTIKQTDGTCLESDSAPVSYGSGFGYDTTNQPSIEIFDNYNSTPAQSYGYISNDTYGATDYPTLRK